MSFRNAKGGYIRPGYDPLEVANPPTGASATAGSASASVSFTAPSNTGGGAITNYYAVSNPGQITASSVTSPISVTGLTNGTEYTFKVWGENSYGPSAYSAPTGSVTPVPNYIEDVFSTYLFTGTGGTQTITNSINLSSEGGLVWTKRRDASSSHGLYDTLRGTTKRLRTNTTDAEDTLANSVTAFNTDGFSIGSQFANAETYASWTFRQAEKFFDVVTYTGNGASNRQISHNLGSAPGFIILKNTSTVQGWPCYHRSTGTGKYIALDSTGASSTAADVFPSVTSTYFVPTSNQNDWNYNTNGETYVAYLFAHDSSSDGLIQCGAVTADGSGNATVNLGWEPQWILIKSSSATNNWALIDNMRGLPADGLDTFLFANSANAESSGGLININSTGFYSNATLSASTTYIYIAIRRGPMKTPTTGTSVFKPTTTSATTGASITVGFPTDMQWANYLAGDGNNTTVFDRLRGLSSVSGSSTANRTLFTASTSAESSVNGVGYFTGVNNTGWIQGSYASGANTIRYDFRRAPGFFDIVCYIGDGLSNRSVQHNLTVAPELAIVKNRTTSGDNWWVFSSAFSQPANNYFIVNGTFALQTATGYGFLTTSTTFSPSPADSNTANYSGYNYVAYLFASCPGVSKVGSYTGTGTTLQVNCGFTGGARFVLIKRTDSTGDWYVWDSARGIVAGNDPYLLLNSTAAEVTNTDYVDTYSAGFEISSTAPVAINANGGTFIFLAIA